MLLTVVATSMGQDKKLSRDQMVLNDRERMANNSNWIYDDLEEAKSFARTQGKPLMVVLRCIP